MFSYDEQKKILLDFLDYIFMCDEKNSPILMLKGDNGIEYFNNEASSDGTYNYTSLISKVSQDYEYGVIYIPDNTENVVRIFLNFLSPSEKTYSVWFLDKGSLRPIEEGENV